MSSNRLLITIIRPNPSVRSLEFIHQCVAFQIKLDQAGLSVGGKKGGCIPLTFPYISPKYGYGPKSGTPPRLPKMSPILFVAGIPASNSSVQPATMPCTIGTPASAKFAKLGKNPPAMVLKKKSYGVRSGGGRSKLAAERIAMMRPKSTRLARAPRRKASSMALSSCAVAQ